MPAFEQLLEAQQKLGGCATAVATGEQLAEKSGSWRSWIRLAGLHTKRSGAATCDASLRKGVALAPNEADAWRPLATHLVARGARAEAIGSLEKLAQLKPRSEDVLRELAKLQHESGALDAARASCAKWLELNPHALVALNELALLYGDLPNRIDGGIALAERAYREQLARLLSTTL